jgi:DNA repair exonuclease SbcCD ATPase subunit
MNEFDYIEQEYGNLKRQYRIMEGDRGAYQQKAQNHIARQDALIKRLRQEETDLTTNLKLAQSTAVSKKDNQAFSEIKNLSQAQQLYIDVVSNEKHTIKNLKQKIERLEAEIYKTTQENGSAISQHENHVGRLKKTRVLENRHNTATVAYNKLLTENQKLRTSIEHFRNQRTVFNTLYKRLTQKLNQQKAQIGTVIDSATCYHDQRDEALSKMMSLRERNDQDLNHFISEYKEMNRIIAHEGNLQAFMNTKNNELSALATQLENERSCGRAIKAEHHQEEEMHKFEKVLNAIVNVLDNDHSKHLTQILNGNEQANLTNEMMQAIQPICDRYRKTEDQNYSLFQFVNEINNDVKRLEEKISNLSGQNKRELSANRHEMSDVTCTVDNLNENVQTHTNQAEKLCTFTNENQEEFDQLQSFIVTVFKQLNCSNEEITSLLNSSTEKANSQTVDIYLSFIENRLNELTKWHNLKRAQDEEDNTDKSKRGQKTPPSRQMRQRDSKKISTPNSKKTNKSDTQNLQSTNEFVENNFKDLESGLLTPAILQQRANAIIDEGRRMKVSTPKTPRAKTPVIRI